MPLPENKDTAALVRVAQEQAFALADLTAAFVKVMGIPVSEMSEPDLLGFAARLMKGAMETSGLLKYIKLETSSWETAVQFAATTPDPMEAADALKFASLSDVGVTLLRNFGLSQDGDKQFATFEPLSSGAKRWERELQSPLHYLTPTGASIVPEPEKTPNEEALLALRAKITITEAEAAELLSLSRKALSNARRAGKVPRSIYSQSMEGGKIAYNTAALLAWKSNNPQRRKEK